MGELIEKSERPRAVHLCALLTTFNRRELTMACLAALSRSADVAGIRLNAIVVDDGSSDDTAAAVASAFPWAMLIAGSGDLYWCRGMHRAFGEAMRIGFDGYLWLNDDTVLEEAALRTLVDCADALGRTRRAPVIVVGSTVDPDTGAHSYGGETFPWRWRPLRVAPVAPTDQPQRCESMNGNIALISEAAAACAGNLDPIFEHAMGDTDYALRARRSGVEIWVAPGVLGQCRCNATTGGFNDPTLPLAMRWRLMQERKGLPWRSWLHFARRHGGALWPLHFAWPYLRVAVSAMGARQRKPSEP